MFESRLGKQINNSCSHYANTLPELFHLILKIFLQVGTIIISHEESETEWFNSFPEVTELTNQTLNSSNSKVHKPHNTSGLYLPEGKLACCHPRDFVGIPLLFW